MAIDVDFTRFIDLGKFTENFVEIAVETTAALMEKGAKERVRVDNSTLRQSITRKVEKDSAEVEAFTPYAAAQEFGLPDGPSQEKNTASPKNGPGGPYTFTPYLRPANLEVADKLKRGNLAKVIGNAAIQKSRR